LHHGVSTIKIRKELKRAFLELGTIEALTHNLINTIKDTRILYLSSVHLYHIFERPGCGTTDFFHSSPNNKRIT
jgi:hypothetical protein